jgi:hypothetical protein
MLLNSLITNRKRRALGDEWQRPSKGVGDGLNGSTLKPGSPLQRVRAVSLDRATVSSRRFSPPGTQDEAWIGMIIYGNKRPCIGNLPKRPKMPSSSKNSSSWQPSAKRSPTTSRIVIQVGKWHAGHETALIEVRSCEAIKTCCAPYGRLDVPVGNLRSEILVVQSAQNWHRQRTTDSLDGTRDWRVLVQR